MYDIAKRVYLCFIKWNVRSGPHRELNQNLNKSQTQITI